MDDAHTEPTESPRTASRNAVVRLREVIAFALAGATPADDVTLALACACLPLLGFALGAAVRALVWLLAGGASPAVVAGAGAMGLWLGGSRAFAGAACAGRSPATARAVRVAVLAAETALLYGLAPAGSLALALAGMLGRWAVVVLAYGSTPMRGDALAARVVRAASFREFGIASVTAMAITLLLVDAVGLLLLFAIATVTIALRIGVHARHGGVSRPALGAALVLGELATLACCAVVASVSEAMLRA